MYNLNYAPTTLGVQSRREIKSEGTRTKKVEYRCKCLVTSLASVCTLQRICQTDNHGNRNVTHPLTNSLTHKRVLPTYPYIYIYIYILSKFVTKLQTLWWCRMVSHSTRLYIILIHMSVNNLKSWTKKLFYLWDLNFSWGKYWDYDINMSRHIVLLLWRWR